MPISHAMLAISNRPNRDSIANVWGIKIYMVEIENSVWNLQRRTKKFTDDKIIKETDLKFDWTWKQQGKKERNAELFDKRRGKVNAIKRWKITVLIYLQSS